ncbi:MAG: CatB-related O-acetyltransferase [Clostridia bacterium]|nr:CatB-related O-acetyltransferase [Clostridia bacterium]
MSIVRNICYFFYGRLISIKRRTVRLAASAKIRPGTDFGEHIKIGRRTWLYGSVGDYTYIGEDCRLSAIIGKYCSISPDVKSVPGSHPLNYISTSPVFFSDQKQCGVSFAAGTVAPEGLYVDSEKQIAVKIGNDVWIGEHVLIKGGITIGDGAVVAMGSVVTKDLEPYGIYAGVPAKLIRKRFDDSVCSELIRVRWWENDEKWLKEHLASFQREISVVDDLGLL